MTNQEPQNGEVEIVDPNFDTCRSLFYAWGRVLGVYNASNQQIPQSFVGCRYLWQGREYSWRTGLYYFRARGYEAVAGLSQSLPVRLRIPGESPCLS